MNRNDENAHAQTINIGYETTKTFKQSQLSDKTIISLQNQFRQFKHRPSEEMWTALEDIASIIQAMADRNCPPLIYVSSLDPGIGKTQTITLRGKELTGITPV